MKTVYLIGDSIRYGGGAGSPGYGRLVAEMLDGKVRVLQPNDNCRFTVYTLRHMRDWFKGLGPEDVDVIHWNNGLWDMVIIDGAEDNLIPVEIYKYYLKRIYDSFRHYFPKARIIFATSTPIIESAYSGNFLRTNAEIQKYNNAAREVLTPLGVEINDLYAFTEHCTVDDYADRKTHFNYDTDVEIAKEVVEFIGE